MQQLGMQLQLQLQLQLPLTLTLQSGNKTLLSAPGFVFCQIAEIKEFPPKAPQ